MDNGRKGPLGTLFGTVAKPFSYLKKQFSKHVGYEVAKRGWDNDSPLSGNPRVDALKTVFKTHAKRLPFLILVPTMWSEFATDLSKALAPDKNSALLPKHQYSTFERDLAKFKPNDRLKRRLQESTSLETSRGLVGSVFKLLGMYWSKAGTKEVAIGLTLAALTLYTSKESVDVLREFSFWGRDFNDFYVNAGGVSTDIKNGIMSAMQSAYDLNAFSTSQGAVLELIRTIVENASAADLSQIDLANALTNAQIDPEHMTMLLDNVRDRFGDLSLDHFAGNEENLQALRDIVSSMEMPQEQQAGIMQAVTDGVDIKAAAADMIDKVQNQFGDLDFEELANPENAAQLKDVISEMDELLAENVLAAGAVRDNVGYLTGGVPGEFGGLLGRFLLYALPAFYTAQHLALRWQTWMVGKINNEWLKYKAAYKVKFGHANIDNPDQRIEENLHSITNFAVDITTEGMQNALKLVAFLPILGAMGSFNPAFLGGPDITIDNFLTWSALGYALVGTGGLGAIAYNLPKIKRKFQQARGTFRAGLMSVHSQPEQIALAEGEEQEKSILKKQFDSVIDVSKEYINKRTQMITFNSIHANIGNYVPLLLAAPQYFAGIITFGQVSQAAGIFRTVENAFSFFMNNIDPFTEFKANVDRTAQLVDGLELARYEELEKAYYARVAETEGGGAAAPKPSA